jgi:hypothetical protein
VPFYARAVHCVGRGLTVVVVAALLGGCGSYTKADFVARADAICASTVRRVRSLTPPSVGDSAAQKLRGLAGYLAEVAPLVRAESASLRALRRPTQKPGERAALARYLHALTAAAGDYVDLASSARRGDGAGVASAEAALRVSPVGSDAASYGLRSCATPGATVG